MTARYLAFASTFLALTLACSGAAQVDGPVIKEEKSPKKQRSILTAGVHFGSEFCTKKSGDNCKNPKTKFASDTPIIHFVHQTDEIPKKGEVYNIQWVALDVGDAAPANTVVFNLDEEVTDGAMVKVATHYTVSTEASKPTAGWPPGSYQVKVTLSGKPVTEAPFTIK
jgi:hypothetical protein